MEEIWKDIIEYEGLYQISNLGRVKRLRFTNGRLDFEKERILKPYKDGGKNYFIIRLSKNGKSKLYQVHRLVAQAFIPNPDDLPIVNHKDENKENNRANNLEWCTQKYNVNYGNTRNKMSKSAFKRKVSKYDIDMNLLCTYNSIKEASEINNINRRIIFECCRFKDLSYKKCYWRYVKD